MHRSLTTYGSERKQKCQIENWYAAQVCEELKNGSADIEVVNVPNETAWGKALRLPAYKTKHNEGRTPPDIRNSAGRGVDVLLSL